MKPLNYRPIALLNIIYKKISAQTACHFQNQALQHKVHLSIKDDGLRKTQCNDHILHVKAKYANVKGSYALYNDFNKAFNSVPHREPFQGLEHNGFSTTTTDIIKLLYSEWTHPLLTGKHPCDTFNAEASARAAPYPPSSSFYTSMLFSLTLWLHTLPLPTRHPNNMSS